VRWLLNALWVAFCPIAWQGRKKHNPTPPWSPPGGVIPGLAAR